jgi:predicted helicase
MRILKFQVFQQAHGNINWEIDLHWNGCWTSIKNAKSKDNTIAEKFNVYRLAYKEQLIDLLARVCTLSIKTMAIIELMA